MDDVDLLLPDTPVEDPAGDAPVRVIKAEDLRNGAEARTGT